MAEAVADVAAATGGHPSGPPAARAIELAGVGRDFDGKTVLDELHLQVPQGRVHALLGPNGAGKTTLLRILCGLTEPSRGTARILGMPSTELARPAKRSLIGLVPSGDRTSYLRLSGLENLLFFGRLHGLRKRAARRRAHELLEAVGLAAAANVRVGVYSHGMQQRLAVARALLMNPRILLVDEATHDLDPAGARRIRELMTERAQQGATVLWATQRIDEIRAFAAGVSVLHAGRVTFTGTVEDLIGLCGDHHYVLRLRSAQLSGPTLLDRAQRAIGSDAALQPVAGGGDGHCLLSLREGAVLGRQLASLTDAGIDVLSCSQHGSSVEAAFLFLTGQEQP